LAAIARTDHSIWGYSCKFLEISPEGVEYMEHPGQRIDIGSI
jgi:hypothetical protein